MALQQAAELYRTMVCNMNLLDLLVASFDRVLLLCVFYTQHILTQYTANVCLTDDLFFTVCYSHFLSEIFFLRTLDMLLKVLDVGFSFFVGDTF